LGLHGFQHHARWFFSLSSPAMQTREARSGSDFYLAQNRFDYKPQRRQLRVSALRIQH
jgi:hypothetical protein